MTELDEIFDDIPRSHSYNTLDSGGLTDTFREVVPKDKFKFAYWTVLLLGTGILIPWISILTAVDYFKLKYPDHSFEYTIAVAYTVPLLLTMLLLTFKGTSFSFYPRILGGFIMFLLVFTAVPFVSEFVPDKEGEICILVILGLVGVTDAISQGSMYGLVAFLPQAYTQAIQTGTGLAGVIISLSRIITKASMPDDYDGLRTSSMIYFAFSSFLLALCVASFVYFIKSPFVLYWINKGMHSAPKPITTTNARIATDSGDENDMNNQPGGGGNKTDSFVIASEKDVRKSQKLDHWKVFKKIWLSLITVYANFSITLMMFPGIVVSIPSTEGPQWTWFPVILVSLFNLFDFVGKGILSIFLKVGERGLAATCLLRLFFLPFFLMQLKTEMFQNDYVPMALTSIFAALNGLIGSRTMMIAPTLVEDFEKELAGTMMAFGLISGLATGSILGYIMGVIIG